MMKMLKKTVSVMLCAALMGGAALTAAHAAPVSGDVDGDGDVTSSDARLALRASVLLERYDAGSSAFLAADVNADGEIQADDARRILRSSVALETLPELRPEADECAYLRSGTFYLRSTVTEKDGQTYPLEMAVSPDGVYTLSSVDGEPVGVLMADGRIYLISPRHQAYLTLSAAVMETIGFGADVLSGFPSAAEFALDPSKADRTEEAVIDGVSCTVYIFETAGGGSKRLVTDGGRLLSIGNYAADGSAETVQRIDYITGEIPAGMLTPPKDYQAFQGVTGLFAFAQLMEESPTDQYDG